MVQADPTYSERRTDGAPGIPILLIALVAVVAGVVLIVPATGLTVIAGVVLLVAAALVLRGLTAVAPGQVRVVQLLGRYTGSIRRTGLRWVNPFTTRRPVSTRIRNHQTEVTKVNDSDGNPIEIAAVVVWQVSDTAKAVFEVDDFEQFVADPGRDRRPAHRQLVRVRGAPGRRDVVARQHR